MSGEQQRWLAELYESNFAAVFKRCGALLKSSEDAADAAHEVFLIALNSLAPEADDKRSRAWLLTVAQNHCLDLLRRRKRFGRALVTLGANGDVGDDLESGVVDRDFVDGVLRQLSLRERMALWQSAVERRSLADIATGLQLSYAATAQIVHRARQRAVRLAASVAAVMAVFRFPRAVRRLLGRTQDAESMLAAQRVLALAALPVIAAVSFPASSATAPRQPSRPTVAVPAVPGSSATAIAPGGLGSMLAPLSAGAQAGTAGGTHALIQPGAIPSVAAPTLKSLADQLGQSTGPLLPGAPRLPSVAPVPGLSPLPSVPPAASLPPGPSLPPIVH
ncbi:MAG: sigma-70 family RNA polymerase sigma factor [Chloroflexi bacterium]|nr:MAG: sigma-70 family RNA polymerase sigma factor [Chloroflexota bacterium]